MTAKEAIDILDLMINLDNKKPVPNRDLVIEAIQMAIKALEAQEWVPVSERLPEDEYVLISKKPTKISGSKWSVAIAIRTADPRSRKIQWRDSGFGVIQDDKVLAWKNLPEPYREDGD